MDDHPKNFAYQMGADGHWRLAPAFDVTFCEGPGGYHQMDVMGEALEVERKALVALGVQEAELSPAAAGHVIERMCQVAAGFSTRARQLFPGQITAATLRTIQDRIDANLRQLR